LNHLFAKHILTMPLDTIDNIQQICNIQINTHKMTYNYKKYIT
jgi:hypothetical protein